MPAKVILDVTQGPMAGRQIIFDEHDSLIFGRMPDCKICMPKTDTTVSRHHFLLEVIPPQATIRDLGSKNGTWVNGAKFGGRKADETPEEGAKRTYPQVELKDGDVIRIGKTYMKVSTERPVICVACGEEIPESDLADALQDDGSYLCPSCQARQVGQITGPSSTPLIIRCLNCGKDVTAEAGPYVTGGYLCLECRELAQEQVVDPMEVLQAMFKEARLEKEPDLNIPDYEMIKQLGRGGMGAVYLVRHKPTGRKLALKIMLPKAELVIKNKIKFQREIEIMQKLGQHEYIVDFYNADQVNGIYYFLMEFCEGGSAGGLATDSGGTLDLSTAGRIMLQALEGLAFAHDEGYVHRDLKPPNILLSDRTPNGIAKIADMGLAKDFTQAGYSGITGKEYAGTLPFMPREQISNFKDFKPVSDVWAMGATIYNLLTNRFPRKFIKDKDPVLCILKNDIVPIEEVIPSIPRRVAQVINTSLEDDIANRYQSALEFKQALESVL
jgi:eukaryotic-like serine/threonine-protein kinase